MTLRAVLLRLRLAACAAAGAALPLHAQTGWAVRGAVHEAAGGGPVQGARVRALAGVDGAGPASTLTTESGAFQLRVGPGAGGTADGARVPLVASRIGFRPETLHVGARDSIVRFRLRRAPLTLGSVVVEGDRAVSASSSEAVRELDIRLRPRESSQELLRLAPGLVIAQHGGGGKAEQIFLRGFDADHGTDVAIAVDGTPVNMVTHGHGQGYADLHFLIPEVVDRIDVRKGPYDARDGDFATAGAVTFHTRDRIERPLASVRGGSFGSARVLSMTPMGGDASRAGGYVALSGHYTDGPFDAPQHHRRLAGFSRWTVPVTAGSELVASASAFGSRWSQSGQLPERAIRSGLVSRYGSLDSTEGGDTERYDASVGLRSRAAGDSEWAARLYATRYRFRLFSNFTFFLADSLDGDGIEQTDDRYVAGALATMARRGRVAGRDGRWSAGAGARSDWADVALFHQRERERLDARVAVRAVQGNLFSWVQRDVALTSRTTLQAALRADAFRFGVRDRLAGRDTPVPQRSGVRWRGIVSPKLNVAHRLTDRATLYANAGTGFHSNDARDVLRGRHSDRVLPRAVGLELGSRYTWDGGSVALALWRLDLQSELVYVGDEGVTEANGPTRRLGTDLEARVRLAPWLWADADLNLARGRYRDLPAGANRIPLAPTATSTGGLTVRDAGPAEGGVRYRFIASRAANEDNSLTARGYVVWELYAAWRRGPVTLYGTVDNLLGREWNEAQFATTSRLRDEPVAVTENHFTPGAPRAFQAGVEYRMR